MYALVRNYFGAGAQELFDLLSQRRFQALRPGHRGAAFH